MPLESAADGFRDSGEAPWLPSVGRREPVLGGLMVAIQATNTHKRKPRRLWYIKFRDKLNNNTTTFAHLRFPSANV